MNHGSREPPRGGDRAAPTSEEEQGDSTQGNPAAARSLSAERGAGWLIELGIVVLRHRWKVVWFPPAVAFLVVLFVLLAPATYTTPFSFMPQGDDVSLGQFSGIAQQFGIDIPTGQPGQSPQFYAEFIESPHVLRAVVESDYDIGDGSAQQIRTGDLVGLLDIEGDTRARRVDKAVKELQKRIGVTTAVETGVVSVTITTRWPGLSKQIGERLIELVNEFNLESRQSQASAEREFIGERLSQAKEELQVVEDSLETFLENNRQYENSPALRFEQQRLQRRVRVHEQVVSSLSRSYEQARISEVRNTPLITVVEPPVAPARSDSRLLLVKALLGLVLGGIVALFWALAVETFGTERDPKARELERLWDDTREEVRGAWRRLRDRLRGVSPTDAAGV